MSRFIPNSVQVPNLLIDELMSILSGNEFKCLLLVIRKTRGWGKEADSISVSQFQKYTGISKPKTVYHAVDNLVKFGWLVVEKAPGKITKYSLSDVFNQCPSGVVAIMGSSAHEGLEPVPLMGGGTSALDGHPTKDTIQNTNTKGACERFIESYPQKVKAKEIRERWPMLDRRIGLDDRIDFIVADIEKRMATDRKWIAGFSPCPMKYLEGERWKDAIDPVREDDRVVGSEDRMPSSNNALVGWAAQRELPPPRAGEEFDAYRARLVRALADRSRAQ